MLYKVKGGQNGSRGFNSELRGQVRSDCGGLGLDCLDNCYIYPDESSARLLNVRE